MNALPRSSLVAALTVLGLASACILTESAAPGPDLRVLDSEHVLGAEVAGTAQEGVGELDDLLIDTTSGTVVAALVRAGGDGPRGIGLVELSSLRRDPGKPTLVVEGTSEELLQMPNYLDLFEGKTPVPLEGEIRGIERAGGGRSEIRLVDSDNLFQRVLIEAAPLVMRRAPSLAVGQRVRFQAIETRDERGKLWIASALEQKNGPLVLRDASGRLQWRSLGCLTSRELVGTAVHTADGREGKVRDWRLDWNAATLTGIELELDDKRYELTWADLVRAADGTWRTPLLAQELRPIDAPATGLGETPAPAPKEASAAPIAEPEPTPRPE